MIGALLERLARRVTAADLVEKVDDTLTVTVDEAGDVSLAADASTGLHARVTQHGRTGWAGGAAESPDQVIAAALASARCGPPLELMLPAPSPLAEVPTSSATAARAGARELLGLARRLRDRLAGSDRKVSVWAERSAGITRVGNTRGVLVDYRTTMVGLGATIHTPTTPGWAPFRLHLAEGELPDWDRIEALGAEAERWVGRPVAEQWEPGKVRAWLLPQAVPTLLEPILAALVGEAWLARAEGPGFALDERLTVVDDPLAPLRPGSRPICDDGVPTRVLTLVERGRPRQGIIDLATAVRSGVPATGHGVRPALGAPRARFSNLRLAPGDADPDALARALGNGILVAALDWGPAPSRATGVFRARAPWTFLVRDGTVLGRIEGAVLSGDAFGLLERVVAVGADTTWRGAWSVPSLVVDGLLMRNR